LATHELSPITSTSNRRIVEARKLRQRKHRDRTDRFLVEGLQIIFMAWEAGVMPVEVFYCEPLFRSRAAEAMMRRLRAGPPPGRASAKDVETTLIPVSEDVLDSLASRSASQGIVAVYIRHYSSLEALNLASGELVVVLDRLRDPGNIGTLIRAADAAGASAVISLLPAADAFDPKAVRSSMGSLFNVPVVVSESVESVFAFLHGAGLRSVAADPYAGVMWGRGLWTGGVALVLGNEAQGLSEDVRAQVQAWARLPLVGKAESLNVSIAGGVLMYAWLADNLDRIQPEQER
jgi:RNA methyltransferase, TrmH family